MMITLHLPKDQKQEVRQLDKDRGSVGLSVGKVEWLIVTGGCEWWMEIIWIF
jgi:hypothetical protein